PPLEIDLLQAVNDVVVARRAAIALQERALQRREVVDVEPGLHGQLLGARIVRRQLVQPPEGRQRAVGGPPALGIVPARRDQLPAGVALVQPQRRELRNQRLRRLERRHRLLVAAALVQLVRLLDLLPPPHLAAAAARDRDRDGGGDA